MTQVQRLATRCNACATSFRVSEEQLTISEGYVRCGRCDAVFNARASLFDLDAPSAPTQPGLEAPAQPDALAAEPGLCSSPQDTARTDSQTPAGAEDQEGDSAGLTPAEPSQPLAEAAFEAESGPAITTAGAADSDRNAAPIAARTQSIEPDWSEPGALQSVAPDRAEPAWGESDADRMLELLGAGDAAPHTLSGTSAHTNDAPTAQRAEAANFRSLEASRRRAAPPSRLSLALAGLAAATLLLALPLHWAWVERDALRAQSPRLDMLLATHWPTLARQGWRHLDGLSVASSSLTPTPQGGAYRLELVVHNRNAHELAMPWLDLQLSDAKGQVLVRRAVAPAELGLARPLAGGEQRPLRAVFVLQGEARAAAGYEIGLFHP